MRRFLGILGIAVTLSVSLFVNQSVVAPLSANACSYGTLEATKSKVFPTVQIWLQVYKDGSGCRHYNQQYQNRSSGPITITDNIRVWSCGTFKGTFGSITPITLQNTGDVFTSHTPSFSYGALCGPQADNYKTSAGGQVYPATYISY